MLSLMNLSKQIVAVVLGASVLIGCGKPTNSPAPAPTTHAATTASSGLDIDPVHGHLLHAQPKLPTIKVWLGDQELITEIAMTEVPVRTGMMFRTNMLENEAMIFVFPEPHRKVFICATASSRSRLPTSTRMA